MLTVHLLYRAANKQQGTALSHYHTLPEGFKL